jgi:hypothetical protein
MLAALVVLPAALAAFAQKAEKSRFVPDRGKLRILLEGQQVGAEEFQISSTGADWTARADVKIQLPGAPASKLSSSLRFGPQGNPIAYDWSLEAEKKVSGRVSFDGGTASVELRQEGAAPYAQQHMFGDPRVVILDNNFYHHFAILGRLYDWEKKGEQTFSVYVPQEVVPGNALVDAPGQQDVDGSKLDVLRLRTADLEVYLYFDKLRLMRITVPGSKVTVVRE